MCVCVRTRAYVCVLCCWISKEVLHHMLAAIDGDDGYTGVKPQHRYVPCSRGTVPHRHLDSFL